MKTYTKEELYALMQREWGVLVPPITECEYNVNPYDNCICELIFRVDGDYLESDWYSVVLMAQPNAKKGNVWFSCISFTLDGSSQPYARCIDTNTADFLVVLYCRPSITDWELRRNYNIIKSLFVNSEEPPAGPSESEQFGTNYSEYSSPCKGDTVSDSGVTATKGKTATTEREDA